MLVSWFIGVEEVAIDMAQNQVTIKGVVEPQALCNIITKKTKRQAKVLSPLPANEGEPIPQVVTSQVIFMPHLPLILLHSFSSVSLVIIILLQH